MSVTNDSLAQRRSELAARRASLSALKQQELGRLLEKVTTEKSLLSVIPKRPLDEPAPLSFAQERLWFLDQLEPESIAYNIVMSFRLTGRLNMVALQQSINETVRRHESLSTTFVAVDGRPMQVITPFPQADLRLVDIAALPEQEREARVQQLANEESRTFDLAKGPLLRTTLIHLGAQDHVLIMELHHIIFDELSMHVLLSDVVKIYQAFTQGQPSTLTELPLQYADFAHWQRQWLRGEVLEEQISYWRRQLHGSPQVLELPTDHPRTVGENKADIVPVSVPEAVSKKLISLMQAERTTPFMTLLAAFQLLLARYTGQDDIPVGTPVAGRRWVETEQMIGFFINTLVMRTKLTGDPTIRELLGRVREVALEAQSHGELPFEKLVEELQPERSLSHTPLFQVMFDFVSGRKEDNGLASELTVLPIKVGNATAKFDLTLGLAEADGKIFGSLEYNADLFDRSTIDRMLGHYGAILEAMAINPDQRLSEIEMLSSAERQQLVCEWNETFTEYPAGKRINQIFEAQVERTPDSIAVQAQDAQLTYREFNEQANRLAHYLRELGAGAESLVGLLVERSPEMIVGLLGILKAGGAYVPLDPTLPPERISLILDDAKAKILLTQSHLLNSWQEQDVKVVCLDTDWPSISEHDATNPPVPVSAENLAYVIYTSGSTGLPKGVAITHSSVVNYVTSAFSRFGLKESDRILQFASVSFDVSVEEIFWPLTTGARCVLRNDEMLSSPETFLRECGALGITMLDVPTGYWNELAESDAWSIVDELRVVAIGGERALPEKVVQWTTGPGRHLQLINAYGPTETTIVATIKDLSGLSSSEREIPIGRPVPNMRAYILDNYSNPVPVGVVGELFLGGAGLARGYLGRPEQTADRFVPDLFSDEPGARLYRTGDLVRRLPNGDIEFFGRVDAQIKLRGYRIELGEIESVLSGHDSVSEVAVIAREETKGGKRLVAYVVARETSALDGKLDFGQLHSYLRKRLPDYMLPSAYVQLDALPLTAAGKVDRRVLPAPEGDGRILDYVAPRTPVEEILTTIWAAVLGVPKVGIKDNFFEVGGHSLLATQLVSRIRETFAVELPLRTLFEQPTVAELAERIEELLRDGQTSAAPPLVPVDRSKELPLSFAQQRLWFLDKLEPGSSLYNIHDAWQLDGPLDTTAFARSLDQLVARHESLRTHFEDNYGEPIQVIVPPSPFPLSVDDLSALDPAERQARLHTLLESEAEQPFDLTTGPLLRVRLFRLGEEEHVLAATMHHIISDEWSMNILTREVLTLYSAHCHGSEAHLAELPIQYADFAVWQRNWLQKEVLSTQLSYWRKQLAGAPAVLELPADRPHPPIRSHRGAFQAIRLDEETVKNLRAVSRRHGATLFMTVLAGFQAVLSRWSGETDLLVGTPVAGRTRGETEGLIGFFVNMLALRTDLSGDPAFGELVHRVRNVCLGAYAHQDMPFEQLVEELNVQRDLSRTPLFQVMLGLQQAVDDSGSTDNELGAAESVVSRRIENVKYDLTLSLTDRGEQLVGGLKYSVDLFDAETMKSFAEQLERAFASWAADDSRRIGEVDLLSEQERQRALVEWNQTRRDYEPELSIASAFERRAATSSAASALTYEDRMVTYEELNRRANKVAHYLISKGVGAEQVVGVYCERSVEMVVALLGVLKAGAAYLPIEVSYPAERVRFMLEDAGVRIVLTGSEQIDSSVLSQVSSEQALEVYSLEEIFEAVKTETNPSIRISPDNLAYVIYTSGSTGRPKGVMITHGAVINHLKWRQERYPLRVTDRFLQKASFIFDISVWEIFGTLLAGAGLVLARPGGQGDPEYLADLISTNGVTVVHFGPALLREFVESEGATRCRTLRRVFCGGEPLTADLACRFHERLGVRLHQQYGPTETCIDVTVWDFENSNGSSATMPIGKPIANTQAYVLDQRLQPSPVGSAGELNIGGESLARGYISRPDLTAERFVPDPFGRKAGARLYRTADRVRYLRDGNLVFMGRLDNQVKIRGYRIETGEIESVLSEHDGVDHAVVIAREETTGDKQLVAYVAAHQNGAGSQLKVTDLRDHLRSRLPDFMVPSFFVLLDEIPLTATGKVDRRNLPAPDLTDNQTYVAPRTRTEKILSDIWETVLAVKPVGVADNFFTLGGDSIRSLRVIALARESGLNFTHQQFFQHQTIAELTAELSGHTAVDENIQTEPFSLISPEDRQKLPAGIEDAYPLSMLQAGMLFHSEFNRDSTLYHNYTSFHIRAPFDEQALKSALQRLLRRHAALRTSFDLNTYSIPLQLVHSNVELPLQVDDLRELSEVEQENVITEWQADEKQRYIDWRQAPLIHFHVHRRGDESFQFSFAEHHAILDGWSLAAMLTELFKTYLTLASGVSEPEEAPPASTFRDFVALEQRSLASKESAEYWHLKLSDRSVTALPRFQSSQPVSGAEGHLIDVPIPPEVSDGLKRLSRIAGVPIKSVLLAAHLRVMSLLGGQQDVLTSVVSHGRPETTDAEHVLGLYLNTLPFRLRLSGGDWINLARDAFAAEQESLPYRYYPMAQMKINEGGELLFETSFSFTHYHVYDTFERQDGIEVLGGSGFGETEFALGADFNLNTRTSQVTLSLTSNGEALSSEQMEAISGYYSSALSAMAQEPTGRYDLQSLLSAQEQQQLLDEWNDTDRQYARDVLLHQFFERHVEQSPDQLAVVFGNEQLSYETLNKRANQLAHRLRALGVGPEVAVGVCLERSVELVVAFLAVMKSGGTYLPMDPSYSAERLSFMLEDASAPVVVSESKLLSYFVAGNASIICLDTDKSQLAVQDDRNPAIFSTPDNISYVIYTSGSTGVPKGVSITQKSLMSYIPWFNDAMGIEPTDRLLQFASSGFDVSMEEILSPLTAGATLVLRSDEMLNSASRFFAACEEWGVTVLDIPTQYWQELARDLSELPNGIPDSIRLVIIGGDQALSTAMHQWLHAGRSIERIINNYGPTETTIVTTSCTVTSADEWSSVPIGKPVGNAQSYILDRAHQPVPIGVAGELCIGGVGLARGYLNRPELTSESFIPNPFSNELGARLYGTGDLARYLPDGNIEFLGRIDTQVKIRGFRIELGEIETALFACPEIKECVVIAREDAPGEKRLVAYVVFARGQDLTPGQLRSFLSERLPDYMVPAQFVVLESLPLTSSDKVDRKALPDPGQSEIDSEQNFVAPRTMVEEVLATIWSQVLEREGIGRESNFFLLGGHSLLAMRIVSRIRESFKVEMPVRDLFEAPVLWELATRIEALIRSDQGVEAPPLRPRADNDQLPLSYAQQRLWVLDQLMPGSNAYNIPAEMYIAAALNVGALEQALSEVVRRHEALRTTFIRAGGQPVQRINPPVPVRLPLVDLSRLGKEDRELEIERLRQADRLKPFDLASGPLLRAALIVLDKEEFLFLVNMHHIVSDGWSMDVLMREMETLYQVFSKGLSSPLAELEVQYADFARWQRGWLQGEVLEAEVGYWKQRLEGAPTLLELGTDYRQQLLRPAQSADAPLAFSEEVSRLLREFSRREGASLFMTLMAGFHALLWRYTGQTDILVGTPIAGRSRVELEPMIGFFVNMIPIRTSFGEAPSFRELVKQVRESSVAAYTHQELPFDRLVEELQPKRAPGRNPVFQVILAFTNAAPDLEMATVNVPAGVPASADVKFDLEVHLQDTPGGVTGSFVYSPELFEPAFISRMVYHFTRLFEQAMLEPDRELSALPLVDEAEYRQVVEEWNDTAVPLPEACIHQILEQEVAQRPDAIAVEFEQEQLSYRELNRRADKLARRLQREGVGAEVFVGVMLERSAELIVALLGIAKAGGVYVPINLTDPPKRIQFVLEDAGVQVLLTTKQIGASFGNTDLTQVYVDDADGPTRIEETAALPLSSTTPDNLAYLMYTSGSTGTPKGVEITHRNVLRLVRSANYADLNAEEIFMQFAPISFDASTFEIWGCLLNGARLVVFPPYLPSLADMAHFVNQKQVTTLWLTSGLFHQLVDGVVRGLGALKQLLAGGEALSPAHVRKALDQVNDCKLINGYGPTETTTFACCYPVPADFSGSSVPIGRPISNTTTYVLNAMQPAGVGERGELFIGGAGLGRGYHNRPDLTAERFVPDPFELRPGDRLYRTGDAARYMNQGLIQFLGRIDDQVKISGFRIEPREIEAVLSSHPAVADAVVVVREDRPGEKLLIAYVVANSEQAPANEELRSYLKERLPEYMVPSAFIGLEALPLTPNGKIDRAALPEPELSLNRSGREYVAPRNDLEQQLVDIWEELFKVHPIGVTDDFFELGGHSLQMIMLVTRVEEKLGKRVPMADLFAEPTIKHLAELIGHGKENAFRSLVVPLQTEGANPVMFSPHAGGGHVWCYKELVRYLGDDQPFYGVQPREPENGLVFHTEIEAMASDYVEAIRGFQPTGPYWLGGWSMGGVIAFEMARQLQSQGERIAMLAMIDAHPPDEEEIEFNFGVLLKMFAHDLGLTDNDLGTSLKLMAALPQMVQFRRVWTAARQTGVVPADMTLVEFRKLFDTFKINVNTQFRYRGGLFQGRVTLFCPEEDKYLDLESRVEYLSDPHKGWGKLTTQGVDLHMIPGNHYSMMQEPHVQILGSQLRNCIQAAALALGNGSNR